LEGGIIKLNNKPVEGEKADLNNGKMKLSFFKEKRENKIGD